VFRILVDRGNTFRTWSVAVNISNVQMRLVDNWWWSTFKIVIGRLRRNTSTTQINMFAKG